MGGNSRMTVHTRSIIVPVLSQFALSLSAMKTSSFLTLYFHASLRLMRASQKVPDIRLTFSHKVTLSVWMKSFHLALDASVSERVSVHGLVFCLHVK